MKTYYKALRVDGTDFATGTTRPVPGEWMPKIVGQLEVYSRGYHVADAPAETLVGGSWPCKLYRVEAKGFDRSQSFKDNHAHKGVCRTYRLVEELPAWQALGPNGEEVAAMIERAGTLTPEETNLLAAAWNAARDTAGDTARDTAGDTAGDTAWYAMGDTALALVVRDLITPEQFDILYGPWRSVIGCPR